MQVLLTFVGSRDPFDKSLVQGEELTGPILSLAAARPFDRIILFSTETTHPLAEDTHKALADRQPQCTVEICKLDLPDPTDYRAILKALRHYTEPLFTALPANTQTFISTASGTPQMHACWLLLAASGEVPARLLQVRPPRFVQEGQPLVTEINLASSEFPTVRPGMIQMDTQEDADDLPVDPHQLITELGLIGNHSEFKKALHACLIAAQNESPVLILGATGTGKELMARLIHLLSGRPQERFIPVNCAALPEHLVESQLFGHKKGAFTGAHKDFDGKFVQADRGTLFLDELGDLPLPAQAKLLRVLQDSVIEPLGADKPQRVNVRFIAATHKDLGHSITEKTFREDLYYRLNHFPIHLPTLDQRKSDIPLLALHTLDDLNRRIKRPKRFTQAALQRLQAHTWPGNIRELISTVTRSVAFNPSKTVLDADDLHFEPPITQANVFAALPTPEPGFDLSQFIESIKDQVIQKALVQADGKQAGAARLLGYSPQRLNKELKKRPS